MWPGMVGFLDLRSKVRGTSSMRTDEAAARRQGLGVVEGAIIVIGDEGGAKWRPRRRQDLCCAIRIFTIL